jgi:hypothetical protein
VGAGGRQAQGARLEGGQQQQAAAAAAVAEAPQHELSGKPVEGIETGGGSKTATLDSVIEEGEQQYEPAPPTQNNAPVKTAAALWYTELSAVHATRCKNRAGCCGMRRLGEILATQAYEPSTHLTENGRQCTQAIEAEEITHMIYHGANIIPRGETIATYESFDVDNYPAPAEETAALELNIQQELAQGILIETHEKPRFITALSVKKEAGGKFRILRDCSSPEGTSVNDHSDAMHFEMMGLRDARDRMRPGWYMAKVDIKAAYRTVGVRPDQWGLLGMKYTPRGGAQTRYFIDTRLPFGACGSAEHFCRISTAVRAMMVARGYHDVIVYVDDFLILAPTKERCQEALDTLLQLLAQLGFTVSDKKTVLPTQELVFLGMLLRTNEDGKGKMSILVPEDKMRKAEERAAQAARGPNITLKQAQKLAGFLNHLCDVIFAARCFTRRITDAITQADRSGSKVIAITKDIKMDLGFWVNFARKSNGKAAVMERPLMLPGLLSTDASDWGMGGFLNGAYFSVRWEDMHKAQTHRELRQLNNPELWPDRTNPHKWDISYREQFAQWWAILLWGPKLGDMTLTWEQDNSVVVANMRRMGAKNPHHMKLIRQIYKLSAERNMRHEMLHVASAANFLADTASRGKMTEFLAARKQWMAENATLRERQWTRRAPEDPGLMEQRARQWMGT